MLRQPAGFPQPACVISMPPVPLLGTDYATADGTCERDFIHVFDLARAHVAALRALQAGQRSLTLNLGSGRATSVRSVNRSGRARHRTQGPDRGRGAAAWRSARARCRHLRGAARHRLRAAAL